MPDYDPFAATPAGFTDEVIGTTTQVEFKPDQFGGFQATFTVHRDEPEVHSQTGELLHDKWVYVRIGKGDDWRAIKGGAAFEHVSGENYNAKGQSKIRQDSKFWKVVERHVELCGRDNLLAKGTPFEASMFEGWHFRWETEGQGVPYKVKDRETGETKEGVTKGYLMPQELVGPGAASFDIGTLALAPDQTSFLEDAANKAATLTEFHAAVMPWMHNPDTGLSVTQKEELTKVVATSDGWLGIRTLI